MAISIYRGNIISSKSWDELEVHERGYVVVEDGVIAGVHDELPEEYAKCDVCDYGDRIIIPAFSDLHMHAPQYVERGVGMDCLLFEWLNTYTFPQESRFADRDYAGKIYPQVIRDFTS